MYESITYGKLSELLQELGFQVKSVKGSHMVFWHPDTGERVILPSRPSDEQIDRVRLRAVTRILTDSRFSERASPEKLIQPERLANKTMTNPTFQIYIDKSGKFHFRLISKEGQVILNGGPFDSKQDCVSAIELLKLNASKVEQYDIIIIAPIYDMTGISLDA